MPADWIPFFHAMGFALLNSVWCFGLAWVIYRTLSDKVPAWTPRIRYRLAIWLLSAAFLFTLAVFFLTITDIPILPRYDMARILPLTSGQTVSRFNNLFPFLALAYLMVLPFQVFRQLRLNAITEVKEISLPNVPMIPTLLKELSGRLGLSKEIRFAFSTQINTPLTYGFWRPVILFPLALAGNLSLSQTEALLLHELAHIRNNDYLAQLVLHIIERLFFFNPFVKKFIRSISLEQELRCDDMVTAIAQDRVAYAEALYQLAAYNVPEHLPFTLKASGDGKWLLFRIARVGGRILPEKHKKSTAADAVMMTLSSWLLCCLSILPMHQPASKTPAFAAAQLTSSVILPLNDRTDQKKIPKIKLKTKTGSVASTSTEAITTFPEKETPIRLAVQIPHTIDDELNLAYLATGKVMERREFTLEVPALYNGNKENQDQTEVRIEPYIPRNSFYYTTADEEVKQFQENYVTWIRELHQALAIAKRENDHSKTNYLMKRIRNMEMRKMRLDALRPTVHKTDTGLKIVSF